MTVAEALKVVDRYFGPGIRVNGILPVAGEVLDEATVEAMYAEQRQLLEALRVLAERVRYMP